MKVPQWVFNILVIGAFAFLAVMVSSVIFGWAENVEYTIKWIIALAPFLAGLFVQKN